MTELARLLHSAPHLAAPRLLGATLRSNLGGGAVSLRICEVEAYAGVGQDPGSHAHRGITMRNAQMFGECGTAYVYFTYGMHWCLNVVCHEAGMAGAVLIRSGEIVAGLETARARRGACRDRDLARGPARLAVALGVTRAANGLDLLAGDRLRLEPANEQRRPQSGPRTGVGGDGANTPWRYWIADDKFVSDFRPAARR